MALMTSCDVTVCLGCHMTPDVIAFVLAAETDIVVANVYDVHSKKKSTSEHLFWCLRLSQIEDSIQYLEGPNSTWKDQIVPGRTK